MRPRKKAPGFLSPAEGQRGGPDVTRASHLIISSRDVNAPLFLGERAARNFSGFGFPRLSRR